MDVQVYRRQLISLETRLSKSAAGDISRGREQVIDTAADSGDLSVADESESEDFTEAELDAAVLQQVRDALRRIEDGTYGRCLVDGRPIPEKRLDAVPWTPYCVKHQTLLEAAARRKPTL